MKLKKSDKFKYKDFLVEIFHNKNNEFFHRIEEGEDVGPFDSEESAASDAGERIDLAIS